MLRFGPRDRFARGLLLLGLAGAPLLAGQAEPPPPEPGRASGFAVLRERASKQPTAMWAAEEAR